LNNPLKYTDPTGEKNYAWDRDRNCYVDEFGNRAEYSDVYRAMFESGYFRGGNGSGYSLSVFGGTNFTVVGYKWIPITVNIINAAGRIYIGNNGQELEVTSMDWEISFCRIPVVIMNNPLLGLTTRNGMLYDSNDRLIGEKGLLMVYICCCR
jgi:hypothetical protein